MPKVSVIILNWNGSHYTIPCIKSILKSSYQDFEIILVDNGSEKKDIEKVEKEFLGNEKIKIIKNKENKGFAEGNNIGVRNSSPESKYALLLNNDTTVGEDHLKELVEGIESDEKIKGIVLSFTPKNERSGTSTLCGFYSMYKSKNLINKEIVPKLHGSGAWFLFDKTVIKEPFDPDYFIYAEDTYLGWLIWLKGYKMVIKRSQNPKVKIIHYSEHSLQKKKSSFSAFLGTRNRLLNLLLFYELRTLIKLIPLILISQFLYTLSEPSLIPARIKAYLWFPFNFKKVLEKRKNIQKQRKVPDEEIIKIMSCKFRNSWDMKNPLFRKIIDLTNKVFCWYCKILGLKTVEFPCNF